MEKILLLIEDRRIRQQLAGWLRPRYDVESRQPDCKTGLTAIQKGDFDLCILDSPALEHLEVAIRIGKAAATPFFLPFLLVTARQNVGNAARHLAETIDEIILVPIEEAELQARVQALLRAREYSPKQSDQELRCANRALRLLSECNQALIRATDEDDLLRTVCRIAVEVGGYRLA